MNTDNMVKVYF